MGVGERGGGRTVWGGTERMSHPLAGWLRVLFAFLLALLLLFLLVLLLLLLLAVSFLSLGQHFGGNWEFLYRFVFICTLFTSFSFFLSFIIFY